MEGKTSERLIQVLLGILILTASALFLWRDTVRPILKAAPSLDAVVETVRSDGRDTAWKARMEDVRAKALEADRERLKSRENAGSVEGASGLAPKAAERTGLEH